MSVLYSVSDRIHGYPPKEQRKFSFALFKNINKYKSTLIIQARPIFQKSHVKMGFYEGVKTPCWKEGGMGRNNNLILNIVFS